jgi:hypothetical protein
MMQQKFDAMLINGRDSGRQWPFYAQIIRYSDGRKYKVPLRYSISFLLRGLDEFEEYHQVRILNDARKDDNRKDDNNKIVWQPTIHNIMYQFANQALTTQISLTFTDHTINKYDTIRVTKLLDLENQEVDFPLHEQIVVPLFPELPDEDSENNPGEWHVTLTIERPYYYFPLLAVPRLPEDNIVPPLPKRAPLYAKKVVSRPPYRRR